MSAHLTDADPTLSEELNQRWLAVRPFAAAGSVCIVAGGLVAAVTRPTDFEAGSWVAAYLVLVGGVAQIALGAGQGWLARVPPGASAVRGEVVTWNGAAALTIWGTLAELPAVTTVGAVLSATSLALFLVGTRATRPTAPVVRAAYRGVVAVILLSAPVGVVLAWMRHG